MQRLGLMTVLGAMIMLGAVAFQGAPVVGQEDGEGDARVPDRIKLEIQRRALIRNEQRIRRGMDARRVETPVLQMPTFAVVVSEDRERAAGYSPDTGEWQVQKLSTEHNTPDSGVPFVGRLVAVVMTGDHIYGYSPLLGKWSSQAIDPKVSANALSITGEKSASVMVGNRVYAYSAVCGKWGELEIPVAEAPSIRHNDQYVSVSHGDVISMFSLTTGAWSSLNWKRGKTINWKDEAKPGEESDES